jgi:hypothetical protein
MPGWPPARPPDGTSECHDDLVTARKRSKRAELRDWLSQTRPPVISEAEFAELFRSLAPISESYLRKLLRDSGVPLTPMITGVHQANLEELESSLLALLDEYERGDPPRRAAVRRLVITAKDHARWASRRAQPASPGSPADPASHQPGSSKAEVILWMITWLENPPVFREWIRLRKLQLGVESGP